METKFIGVEGYNEIESIASRKKASKKQELGFGKKSIRFVKRASILLSKKTASKYRKLTASKSVKIKSKNITASKRSVYEKSAKSLSVIDRHYNENRSSAAINGSVREAMSGMFSRNTVKCAHSAPTSAKKVHIPFKKKVVPTVAASVLVIAMTCVTAAGALSDSSSKVNYASPTCYNDYIDRCDSDYINCSGSYESTDDEAFAGVDFYNKLTSVISVENNQADIAGLYIDDAFMGAVDNAKALNEALQNILADYRKGYDKNTTTEFANNVEVKTGDFNKDELMTVEEIIDLVKDKLSISLSTDMVYTREIEYESIVEYDESKPASYEEIKTEGVNGEEQVTIRTTFTDGVQTDAFTTDSKVITEAINEVIIRGGSEETELESDISTSYATGSFIWPLPYTHNITSTYGARWGTIHGGIDISDSNVYGQEIVASDSGMVVFAGDCNDGYGYYVIIDHGNGYQTYYAHCSSLVVSTGQAVAQGQTIAYVGSTGDSTGPHLHFEIRIDGERTDPLNYVG